MKKTFVPAILSVLFSVAAIATPTAPMDIVDTAVSAGQFKILVTAVQAAGLVETLKGPGPFTVFAPTDAAFAKLPEGTVQALLNDVPTLKKILTYHVAAGSQSAATLEKLATVTTLHGEQVAISTKCGKIYINDAEVIMPNIKASNGLIQVIDTVLMPQ